MESEKKVSAVELILRENGVEYALKRIKIGNLDKKDKENTLNEVRLLASIKNPYVIGFREAFFDESTKEFCIVTDFAEGGDLFELIKSCSKEKVYLQEVIVWRYLHQIAQGLKYLHDMHIIHRDIKGANILLNKDRSVVMLGDMNVSKVAKSKYLFTQTGTPYYASPEVWRDEPYDLKSDIWSLGCLVYELCALLPPFRGKDMESLFAKIQAGKFVRIPRIYSDELADTISSMLKSTPSLRPDCGEILRKIEKYGKLNIKNSHSLQSDSTNMNLLGTIEIPKDLRQLEEVLPHAKYNSEPDTTVNYQSRSPPTQGAALITKPKSAMEKKAIESSLKTNIRR